MRMSLDNFRRWWRHPNGNGDVNSSSNGNGNGESSHKLPDAAPPPAERKPVEPPWLAQLDKAGVPRRLCYPSAPLGRMLDQSADRFADAGAIVYPHTKWTYRELLAHTNRLAAGLVSLGVRKGDRVLLTLPNCPEFVTTFFAVQKLGAVVVNAGPLMGQLDLSEAIRLARPRVSVGLDLRAPHLLAASTGQEEIEHFVWTSLGSYQTPLNRLGYQFKLWWQGRDRSGRELRAGISKGSRANHVTLDELLEHAPSRPPTIAPELDEVAILQPTGGTTGALKLARLTHRSLLANCTQVVSWMNLRHGQERLLAALPMFHIYGLMMGVLAGVFTASELVLMTRFAGPEALELLRKHRVTIFPLVPAICDALSDLMEAEERPAPLRDLRLCISGAAPLSAETAKRFERLTGASVIEGYGLTEASPVTHAGLPGSPRRNTIGLPLSDTRVRVVDPATGIDVTPGESGEMLIAGPQLMAGYLGNPEQTQATLRADDEGTIWLHTGDIVRYDTDGFFQVVDRKKDMINHAGLKVFPSRVEQALRGHAQVKEVTVIGRPDPVFSEKVVAVVVPVAPPENPTRLAREMRLYCRERLAPYEVPAEVEFVDALPRSALGKVLRKDLRAAPANRPEALANEAIADDVETDSDPTTQPPTIRPAPAREVKP